MIITLVVKSVAEEGYRFTHMGGIEFCNSCSLFKVCIDSLQKYRSYIVRKVRKKEHSCLIGNQVMIVCEVEEANSFLTVKDQKFLENILLTREPNSCKEILCKNFDYCVSPGYNKPTKIKVIHKKRKIKCPLGNDLVLVEAQRV